MSFDSWHEFLAMGKHGLYVWSCYGLTLVVLLVNVVRPLQMRNKFVRQKQQAMTVEQVMQNQLADDGKGQVET